MKKLTRSDNRILGGVLAGIGEYSEIDPTVVRLIYAFITVFTGLVPAILVYIIALAIMPTKKHHASHEKPESHHTQ